LIDYRKLTTEDSFSFTPVNTITAIQRPMTISIAEDLAQIEHAEQILENQFVILHKSIMSSALHILHIFRECFFASNKALSAPSIKTLWPFSLFGIIFATPRLIVIQSAVRDSL
jgi:hypothetical protein